MNYLIVFYCLLLALVRQRKVVLLFPILCFFTPKGFGLIDVPSLPYLSVNRAIIVVMVSCFLLHLIAAGFRVKKTHFPLALGFILLGTSYLASFAVNPESWASDAVTALMDFTEIFFPCYLIWYLCKSAEQAERVLKWIYAIGIVVSLYGTLAYFTNFNPYLDYLKQTTPTGRVLATNYDDSVRGLRAVGTLSHPITYGAFQAFTFLIGIFLMRNNRSATRLIVFIAMQLLLLIGIVVTNSRTPLIFVLFSVLAFTCLARTRDKMVVVQISIVILTITSIGGLEYIEKLADFVSSAFSQSNASGSNGSSLQMRAGQFLVAWKFFTNAPIFGGGVSQTRSIVASGAYPTFYNAESALFQWAIDLGTVGLVAYATLFAQIYRAAKKKCLSPFSYAVIHALTTGYIVFVLATGVLETMQLFLVTVVLMLIASGDRRAKSSETENHCQEVAKIA